MADKYKIVLRTDNRGNELSMWDIGCPLMIETVQVVRSKTDSATYLQVKVLNVGARLIERYSLRAEVSFEDSSEIAVEMPVIDADIPSGLSHKPGPQKLSNPLVDNVKVSIMQVSLDDGSEWSAGVESSNSYSRERLTLSDKASKERSLQLSELGFDSEKLNRRLIDEGGFWFCACGQPNVERATCVNCNAEKVFLKTLESESELEALSDQRAMNEKRRVEQAEIEREIAAEQRKKILAIVIPVGAIIAIAAVVFFGIIQPEAENSSSYDNAFEMMLDGNYSQAAGLFTALGNYRDSSEQVEVCTDLSNAQKLQQQGDPYAALKALEPYGDDARAKRIVENSESMIPASVFDIARLKTLAMGTMEQYFDTVSASVDVKDFSGNSKGAEIVLNSPESISMLSASFQDNLTSSDFTVTRYTAGTGHYGETYRMIINVNGQWLEDNRDSVASELAALSEMSSVRPVKKHHDMGGDYWVYSALDASGRSGLVIMVYHGLDDGFHMSKVTIHSGGYPSDWEDAI